MINDLVICRFKVSNIETNKPLNIFDEKDYRWKWDYYQDSGMLHFRDLLKEGYRIISITNCDNVMTAIMSREEVGTLLYGQ
jgi:hypothetical protein